MSSALTWTNTNRAAGLVDSSCVGALVRIDSGGCCENSNDEGGLHVGGGVDISFEARERWEGS